MNEYEYEQENHKEYLGLLDSKAVQLPAGLFLQVLPNLQPKLSIPIWDGLSFLYSLLGNSGIIGNPPIFFTYALVCILRSLTTSLSTEYKC